MKKTVITLLIILLFAVFCFLFMDFRSEEVKDLDYQINQLARKEISLSSHDEIYRILQRIDALSEKDSKSMKSIEAFDVTLKKYMVFEDQAVVELEAIITALPAPSQLTMASEDVINEAASAYRRAPEGVKKRISNYSVLQTVQQAMEQYKEDCWVKCENCGGDGKVTCSLCNGRGSRKVNYTTPNGKTWQVYQDCKTTSRCGECSGKGGEYIEK